MTKFKEFNLNDKLVKGLAKDAITIPTDIQTQAIPVIMEGKDLIGEAVTGSGKTLTYLLPSFEHIDTRSKNLHTLVIAPTHELVVQIHNVMKDLAKNSDHPVKSLAIMGNVNIKRQIESLKIKPHMIVGTPGRLLELIKAKKIKAHLIQTIVIDEADKLLSDNNHEAIKDIIKTTMRDRQLLAFSASISDQSLERAKALMKTPEIIQLKAEKINNDIEHFYLTASRRDKINLLRKVISSTKPTKAIVFLNKNELIQDLRDRLLYHQVETVAIFGNARKADRKKALDAFKTGSAKVLVASDLVARGMDLPNITHVFNLDIPADLNEYTHRVGRTGRAGKKGTAISIVTPNEVQFVKSIERLNGIKFYEKEIVKGKLYDPKVLKYPKKNKPKSK